MALAEKTKRQKILENDKRTYTAWLSDNGINAEKIAGEKIAKAMKDSSLSRVDYGVKAQRLSEKGLLDDGYAEYLRSSLQDKAAAKIKTADEELIQNRYKNARGYAEYVEKYNALQGKIMESVKKTITDMECFDINQAYEIALKEGLSDENAMATAALGVNSAREKVTDDVIRFVLKNRLTEIVARRYAMNQGLSEPYVKRVEKAVRSSYYYTGSGIYDKLTVDELEEYLKSRK
jgi:hypothetical protein